MDGTAVSETGGGWTRRVLAAFRGPRGFLNMILLGLAIRFVLAPLTFNNFDVTYWVRIANMAESGVGLYGIEGYYYTSPWGYFVAFAALVSTMLGISPFAVYDPDLSYLYGLNNLAGDIVPTLGFVMIIKVMLILVDVAVAFLIRHAVVGFTGSGDKAVFASALWFLCPLVIFESSVHGMFDCISALFLAVSVILLTRRRYALSGLSMLLAAMTKFFPLFMVPVMLAWIVRREGLDRNGAVSAVKYLVGLACGFILLVLPDALAGDFAETLSFITTRAGTQVLRFITPVNALILAVLIVAAAAAAWIWCSRNGGRVSRIISEASAPGAERRAAKALAALWAVAAVAVLTLSFLMGKSASAFMMLAFLLSAAIELYLAYVLLFKGDLSSERLASVLVISSLAVFIWSPAPQYLIFMIPFLAVYASVCKNGLVRPMMMFAVAYSVLTLAYGHVAYLIPMESIGLISDSFLESAAAFLSTEIFGTTVYDIISTVADVAAEATLVYLAYRWYRESGGYGVVAFGREDVINGFTPMETRHD